MTAPTSCVFEKSSLFKITIPITVSKTTKPQPLYFQRFINIFMKEGAYIGGVIALLVYFMLPIYGDNGAPASLLPTGNVASTAGFSGYVSNLPFSMLVFFALEILGVSVGIASQIVLRKVYKQNQ